MRRDEKQELPLRLHHRRSHDKSSIPLLREAVIFDFLRSQPVICYIASMHHRRL